jgi:uncharacterized protein YodC (DUF2158 family)
MFSEGETVRLKSGGPLITIVQLGSDNWVQCMWFDDASNKKDWFNAKALIRDDGS